MSGHCHSLRAESLWTAGIIITALLATMPAAAHPINDEIGFSPNHIYHGLLEGENVNVLTGNLSLRIPLGPRFSLDERHGYQLQLYYNSKIWEHDCDPLTQTTCTSELVTSDNHGTGMLLHFGRIYHHPKDRPDVYRYQTPDGGEFFFESPGVGIASHTVDASSFRITKHADHWEVYPYDGTKIVLGHDAGSDRAFGGWYATRIETLNTPSKSVNIIYHPESDRIDRIEQDLQSDPELIRTVNFEHYDEDEVSGLDRVDIIFPGINGDAVYTLHLNRLTDKHAPLPGSANCRVPGFEVDRFRMR